MNKAGFAFDGYHKTDIYLMLDMIQIHPRKGSENLHP